MTTLYFIKRNGEHSGELYWIGNSIEEGRAKGRELASNDVDNWHDWCVYEYVPNQENPSVTSHVLVGKYNKKDNK